MDDFQLEHSIIESNIKEYEALELPLSQKVFRLLILTSFILGSIVFARIAFFSLTKGDFYKTRSEMNYAQPFTLPAIRGLVYDRFGALLAKNKSSYRLVLNTATVKLQHLDADSVLEKLSEILGIETDALKQLLEEANLEKNVLVTLGRNISPDQVDLIRNLGIPALEIQDDYRREYLRGPAFAHVLGYTGLQKFNDIKGKTGLEKYYDDTLGGIDGIRLMYRNAKAEILDEKLLLAPQNGKDLHLTIDAGLQEYFYDRLSRTLSALGRNIGVGIALNPQNGEVLALVNLPSYDNNVFTDSKEFKKRGELLTASFQPLFDRAVSGVYSPGSTIKPLVAVAALNEGVIDPKKQIFSAGFIEIPNPYFPDQPSRFLDWKAHGWVDLRSAIARSSNVYFYEVGGGFEGIKGLGIEKLKEYWKRFGLDVKTGIDLDAESIGYLPDPDLKVKRTNDQWRLGDTYNVSIGQGDLQITPIQLINYIGAIANGGTFYKPHLVKNIPEVIRDITYLSKDIKEAQEGMKDGVVKSYGTSHLLADLPVSVAAKTGSAQVSNNTKTNAFFVGYSPAQNPQIAILVLIENAREGSLNAVPIAKDVLDWYYWNRLATSH